MSWVNKKKVIYDFGSNTGNNIPYYLTKSDLVVSVEANPLLTEDIKVRFSTELSSGKLAVESCILSIDSGTPTSSFYIHKTNHKNSQFPRPDADDLSNFHEVTLPVANVVDLIRRLGDPYYIKIDIEHYDHVILQALFENNIKPPYISAEATSIEVFAMLVALGGYQSFNLINGESVPNLYREHPIKTTSGEAIYSFPINSAGPFGEDIVGPWMTRDNFFRYLAFEGVGWKDIHATTEISADPSARARIRQYVFDGFKQRLKRLVHA